MIAWMTCPKDVESYVFDERERPADYKEHFYPCYIDYEEPWDLHFCGYYYFVNETKKEAIEMRRRNLEEYLANCYRDIELAKIQLKKLDNY